MLRNGGNQVTKDMILKNLTTYGVKLNPCTMSYSNMFNLNWMHIQVSTYFRSVILYTLIYVFFLDYAEGNRKYKPYMPAHVFGNMWAQSWTNLFDIVKPFEVADNSVNQVVENLQNYTIHEMFELADKFFTSMGLPTNNMSFDASRAMIERPENRDVVCHASAWDFCDGVDYRIKMCTKKTKEDLITIHHEMGHIQYFIQYNKQPLQLRGGAHPGFHEAIGDVIALSFDTPKHLKKV